MGKRKVEYTDQVVFVALCCHEGCGYEIWADPAIERRWRRTHERWYCPGGHSQHFDSESDQEKAERLRQEAKQQVERAKEREAAAKLAKDRAARTCPWPTCDGRMLASPKGLRQHMVKAHGAPWAMPEVGADEIGQVLNGKDQVDVVR